jgi:hypothetical protein
MMKTEVDFSLTLSQLSYTRLFVGRVFFFSHFGDIVLWDVIGTSLVQPLGDYTRLFRGAVAGLRWASVW